MRLNDDAIKIHNTLCENGFDSYVVGGFVRDLLNNDTSNSDIDIATNATPDEIENLFKSNHKVKMVGKSFGVVIVDDIEVATFRNDSHNGIGDRNCTTSFSCSIEEDLSRRDFTINAMAICNVSGDIIDPHNGKSDLKENRIRFVGNATQRIMEDPNRIIRACRFLAKLQGEFEYETLRALKLHSHLIKSHVQPERIRLEILKAMKLETPSLFFSALQLIGALDFIFPEMVSCYENGGHGKHHKETIFEHLMMCGDHLSKRKPLLRLAGYLHDIGKPRMFQRNNNGTFVGHEDEGKMLCHDYLTRLKFSNDEVDDISFLVGRHMDTMSELTKKSARKLRKRLYDDEVSVKDFLMLKIADRKSNMVREPYSKVELKDMIYHLGLTSKEEEVPFTTKSLALSGGDIIRMFNISGPIVGKIQKHLLGLVIEHGPELNTFESLLVQTEMFLTFYNYAHEV